MKNLILLIILASLGFQGCKLGATRSWGEANIKQSLIMEIETLDKKVIESVSTNNVELLKSIMADDLLEKSEGNIDQLIEQVSSLFKSKDYIVLNRFQTENSTVGVGNTVMSGVDGINDYVIHYQAMNEEMFISLLIPKSGSKLDKFIITNIYGKYPEGWRLNILQFGQYKVNGRTAPELYSEAKKDYDEGYLISAANNLFLSSRVANPANKFWKYQKENEIKEFYEKVKIEINSKYKFPITLEEIDSKPQVLTVYPKATKEGCFPMIEYLTNLELGDTIKTKAEYEKIHSVITKLFYGIEKDKDYIFYKAFSEIPNGKTPVPTYGFVKELR